MYLLLVFLSIIGSCLAGLFGRHLGSWGSAILTTSCLFLSFLLSLFVFYEVALVGCFVYIKLATWISSEVLHVDWGCVPFSYYNRNFYEKLGLIIFFYFAFLS